MPFSMKNFILIPHKDKAGSIQLAVELISWFEQHNCTVYLSNNDAELVNYPELGASKDLMLSKAEAVIVLGGDGAILGAAHDYAPHNLAILGVNFGRLGFLTELERDEVEGGMAKLIEDDYSIEERMLLSGRIVRSGKTIQEFTGLNDAVIAKGVLARLIKLKMFIDNEYFTTYPADGLIVSTPTGSSAYSLSAGGPMCEPTLETLIITPICAHTFYSRSLIISANQTVRVIVKSDEEEIVLTIDGRSCHRLKQDDEIYIGKSDIRLKMLKLQGRSFYSLLRGRLSKGVV